MATIEIVRADITTLSVDVVVNAANSALAGGGGVDGAIHRAAGPQLAEECRELRRTSLPDGLPTGQAVATGAGEMACRWVIHTVGPVWSAGDPADQEELLADCYRNCLALAEELGARSVAFPAISAGVYGAPMEVATRVAVRTCMEAPTSQVETILLVAFNDAAEASYRSALAAPKP